MSLLILHEKDLIHVKDEITIANVRWYIRDVIPYIDTVEAYYKGGVVTLKNRYGEING